ncbi:MAG: hypothetical protein GX817_04410 [Elusimicrobia bacterium]|nr:hypothetical protein [Elusimicrobiota bacterium]
MKAIKIILLVVLIGAAVLITRSVYLSIGGVSEENYIEMVARVSAMRMEYEDKSPDEADLSKEELDEIAKKAEIILSDLSISVDSLKKFDKKHPGFLEKPENQIRLFMRLNELIEEKEEQETSA